VVLLLWKISVDHWLHIIKVWTLAQMMKGCIQVWLWSFCLPISGTAEVVSMETHMRRF
jgi:hypothetical protein